MELGSQSRVTGMYGCVMPSTGGEWCVDASFPKSAASPPDLSIIDGDLTRFQSTDSKGKKTTYVLTRALKEGERPERIVNGQELMTTQSRLIPFTKAPN